MADTGRSFPVLFFAKSRELAGRSEGEIVVEVGIHRINGAELLHRICVAHNLLIIEKNVILALNGEFCSELSAEIDLDTVQEIAVIPPISGG